MKNWFHLIFFLLCISCNSKNRLESVLSSNDEIIKKVITNFDKYQVQIKFTEVIKEKNAITFSDSEFQVDDRNYFYPASSVKFPIAVLALEKLNEFNKIDLNTPFRVKDDSITTTIGKEIIKIFAVSDNEAYNRLFEFLGQDYVNKKLNEKGINAKITHRLSTSNSADLTTKDVYFFANESDTICVKGYTSKPIQPLNIDNLQKGKGFMKNDFLIKQPMDFSKKNYLPISSLHGMMKRLIFPEKFVKHKRFHLSIEDSQFLLNSMKILPRNAGYNPSEYYDGYVKFFIFGDTKGRIPDDIEIYNKVGYAYGYLTDCAYIINKKTGKEFIISATIHVNENQIFNDDNYEYDSIGIPFLAELGRQLTK